MKLHRCILHLVCCFTLLFQSVSPAFAQFSATYKYYIDLSKESIAKNDYQSFLFYLEAAHSADPSAKEPFELLKNVRVYQSSKQLLRGYLLQAVEALERDAYQTALFYFQLSLLVTPDDALIKEYIDYVNKLIRGEIVDKKPLVERIKKEYKLEVPIKAQVDTEKLKEAEEVKKEEPVEEVKETVVEEPEEEAPQEVEERIIEVTPEPKRVQREEPAKKIFVDESEVVSVIPMDEELWAEQPNTTIEIEFNKSVILEGHNIDRYLVLNENYIEVARLDRDRIQITSLRRGDTLFHVWDDRGRWTFNIVGVLPLIAREGLLRSEEELWEEYVEPFRLAYSNNWSAFYLGDSPQNLHRTSLAFTQFVGLYGGTPYGEFDASLNFFKFEESTENTGRAIGLTNGHIGPFKEFTIRGYDTYSSFSDLSLPGRYFRGGLIDAYAFHKRLKYTYLRGQDRANFITLSEGQTEVRKSYIEGASLTFNPDTPHQYSVNFARGWGVERPPHLKDRVFSADTEHQYGKWNVRGELAYDEDATASLVRTRYEGDNYTWRINARDIDKDFVTITSRPNNQGEVGGNVVYDWEAESGMMFSAGADLYRDRKIPNPDDPNTINYDLNTYVNIPLSETMSWSNGVYYLSTPQLISPQQNLQMHTSLSKSFRILNDRALTTHLTGMYQRNRFDETPQSEYDRFTANAGFRLAIFRLMSYYLSYEQSWVDVIQSGEETNPSVLSMGLSYTQTFKDLLTAEAGVSWRDEEDTDGRFTFLSGTDILEFDMGLTYHPSADFEIFLDGSLRNVMGEGSSQPAFHDADVRIGLRTAWDTIFRWNPKAAIQGYVFKDLNKNGIREAGEPGVEGIKVRVGDYLIASLNTGYYGRDVRAKEVKVALDLDSIPSGYSLTSDESKRVVIENGSTVDVDFGMTVRTEIYGVVFVDENQNKKYDSGEKTVPTVRIKLDDDDATRTDFEGIFTFNDVIPGKHTLTVDVNSIPLEYLPNIKLKHEIVVEEGSSYDFDVPLRMK